VPSTATITNAGASLAADALLAQLNGGGKLRIYDGAQPATADTAVTAQTLLAELSFSATAFGPAVNGVATANAITGTTALATGIATWFRTVTAGGAAVFDGKAARALDDPAADLVLNSVAIGIGADVNVDALPYTQRKAA
jgi:hypothetical protein